MFNIFLAFSGGLILGLAMMFAVCAFAVGQMKTEYNGRIKYIVEQRNYWQDRAIKQRKEW